MTRRELIRLLKASIQQQTKPNSASGVIEMKAQPIADRFWTKVKRAGPNECWEWSGARSRGYGQIGVPRSIPTKMLLAHRVSYELHHGISVPSNMVVMHTCDNPPCVNPAHLKIGTRSDNQIDSSNKKRHFESSRTTCHYGHSLDGMSNIGRRYCKTCRRNNQQRSRSRHPRSSK